LKINPDIVTTSYSHDEPLTNNWSYKGKSELNILLEEETGNSVESEELAQIKKIERNIDREEKRLLKAVEEQIASVTPEISKPKAPQTPNPNAYIFDFEVNKKRFPELAPLMKMYCGKL